ncbi:MAG: WD40 repeat domain-containing protein, partial [Candidatus Solibacter sp.]|nr:WD40 repeat domain-containing protein [Candidatus Solibacter sp.]
QSEPRPSGSGFRGLPHILVFLFCLTLSAAEPIVPVTALAFSPDGKTLVSGAYQEVRLWDVADGKLVRKLGGVSGQVRAVAFGKDGRTLAVAAGVAGRSGAVLLLDLETGAITPIQQAKDEMLAVAVSTDGRWLATGGTDSTVRVWNLETQAAPLELKGHTDWISGLAFSPDGRLLASSSADKTARVWKTETWKEAFQLPAQITEPVSGVAFATEGDLLAFAVGGPEERSVRVWRTQGAFTEIDSSRPGARNQVRQTRLLDTGACMPLAVTFAKAQPRSRMVVGCTDKTVRLMGPNGNTIATAAGHADWVYAEAASPDGLRLASGSGDGTVKLWGPAGRLLLTLGEGTAQP